MKNVCCSAYCLIYFKEVILYEKFEIKQQHNNQNDTYIYQQIVVFLYTQKPDKFSDTEKLQIVILSYKSTKFYIM